MVADFTPDAMAAIQAWEALGRPPIPIVDMAVFLRTADPATPAERVAAIAWVRERSP